MAQILLVVVVDGSGEPDSPGSAEPWDQVASMARIEVYQATGMTMVQLKLSPSLALARLRTYAFANDQTVDEVARQIVSRELRMEP